MPIESTFQPSIYHLFINFPTSRTTFFLNHAVGCVGKKSWGLEWATRDSRGIWSFNIHSTRVHLNLCLTKLPDAVNELCLSFLNRKYKLHHKQVENKTKFRTPEFHNSILKSVPLMPLIKVNLYLRSFLNKDFISTLLML